ADDRGAGAEGRHVRADDAPAALVGHVAQQRHDAEQEDEGSSRAPFALHAAGPARSVAKIHASPRSQSPSTRCAAPKYGCATAAARERGTAETKAGENASSATSANATTPSASDARPSDRG